MEFAFPFRPTLRFVTFWWFCVLCVTIGTVLPCRFKYSTERVEFAYYSIINSHRGWQSRSLDIFTVPWSILYKAMVSSSVLHRNAFIFVSVASVSNESKPSHSFFCVVRLIVLPNEKHCKQRSCKQSSCFQLNYLHCGLITPYLDTINDHHDDDHSQVSFNLVVSKEFISKCHLNNQLPFFKESQILLVVWMTEKYQILLRDLKLENWSQYHCDIFQQWQILEPICDEAGSQVVQRSRISKPRAVKGSEDLTKNNSR